MPFLLPYNTKKGATQFVRRALIAFMLLMLVSRQPSCVYFTTCLRTSPLLMRTMLKPFCTPLTL